jgi:hypothetical protein
MKNTQLLLIGIAMLFAACSDNNGTSSPEEFIGEKISIGNGQAWTFINVDAEGVPTAIGVRFDSEVLEGLPTGSMFADEFILNLSQAVTVEPYDHFTMDWNEHGHESPGVYDIPHFDFHFYFMTEAERNLIKPTDDDQFNAPMEARYLPPDYLETPGGVPHMGAHIIDLLSPEIAGSGIFTYTFIYGKYKAEINFLEPMVTQAFLESKSTIRKEIRQPQQWQKEGYYPQDYTISYDADTDVYEVALVNLKRETGIIPTVYSASNLSFNHK